MSPFCKPLHVQVELGKEKREAAQMKGEVAYWRAWQEASGASDFDARAFAHMASEIDARVQNVRDILRARGDNASPS